MTSEQTAREDAKLGPFLATLIVACTMVGSGIYILPATLATIGTVSIFGWLLSALGALALAGVFSALVMLRPDIDGVADYARWGFGRYAGFQSGLLYWASNWSGVIAVAVAITSYLSVFAPVLRNPLVGAASSVAVIWLVTLANIVGARFVGRLSGVTLALGLLPVLAVGLFGWFWFDPELFAKAWNPGGQPPLKAVGASLVLIFFAFTGVEGAIVAASVVRNPRRNIPIATFGGVALATVVYILASTAIAGLVPHETLARSDAPFSPAVLRMLGPLAASAVAICAVIKSLGTFSSLTLLTGETTRASAATGYFPGWLARTRADGMPVRAFLFVAALESVLVVVTISPTLNRQFNVLVSVSTLLTLVMYAWCALSLLRFSGQIEEARTRLLARLAAAASLAFCVWAAAATETKLLVVSLAIVAATIPVWALVRFAERARPQPAGA